MIEIYWLTRLDSIICFFFVIALITGMSGVIMLVVSIVDYTQDELDKIPYKKVWIGLISTCIISSFIMILTPSTKDMYMIYGIGGSIDYLRENETAKQLPDKCINFIDKWVDENLKTEESCQKN